MDGNKKIAINTIIIYVRLLVVSIVSIVLSRVVLDALGASDYGLYNVVGGIVLLLNVLNSSMASTTYRYIAYELGKGNGGDTNKVFNTSILIHLGFALLIMLVGTPIGDWYIDTYLNVPNGNYSDAHFVFHLSILTAAVNTVIVPFQGLLVAFEEFRANATIEIVANLLKLIVIYLLIYSVSYRLQTYSIILFSYTLLSGAVYVVYSRIKHNEVVKWVFQKDKKLYREMLSFSGWTLVGATANVGKAQGSAIIINYFFGTLVNAAYAIAHQIETFVLMFARTIGSAAVPQTTKSFSAGNVSRSIELTSHISKYTFLLMVVACFPLLVEMDFLLDIWLKEVPQDASVFCKLILLGNLLGCLGEGFSNLINASGRIKAYQIVVHAVLLSGLPISFFLYKKGSSPNTILIVYCIISFVNSFVKLFMLRRVVSFNVLHFMKESHFRIFLVAVPLLFFYFMYSPGVTTLGHIEGIVLSELVTICSILVLGLGKSERNTLFAFVKKHVTGK